MLIRALETTDLLLDTDRAAVAPSHKRTDKLPPQRLEVALERDQLAIVLDEEGLVLRRLGADRSEELLVLLVLAQQGVVGAHDAGPEGAQELRLEALLRVALADDGALQVEELAVDVLEEGEEGGRVGEFGVDAFFEDVEELVESAVQGLRGALRVGGAEDCSEELAERGGEAGRWVLQEANVGEESVDVCEGGAEGAGRAGRESREFAFGPVHND